jgi:tetratricopeptide (TPR) repeat protein
MMQHSNKYRILGVLASIIVFCLPEFTYSQPPEEEANQSINYELNIVRDMQRFGQFETALRYLDALKDKHGENPAIISLYKSIYLDAKMYAELEDLLRREISKSPNNAINLAELGNVRFLRDDPDGADSLWSLALQKSEKNQAVYIYVANYKLRYGDYEGAAETYLLGRDKFGIPNMFADELANIYESQRNYPAAVNEYLNMLITTPDRLPVVSSKILGVIEDTEDVDAIINAVKDKIEKNKDSEVLYEMLGDIYIKTGRMKLALETYRILGKGKNDDGESLYKFAERCIDFEAYDTAIEAVDEYLSKSKNQRQKDSALFIKAEAQMRKGYNQQALGILQGLAGSAGNPRINNEAGYKIGNIYVRMGLRQEAITAWQNALDRCSDPLIRTKILFDMADSYVKLHSFDRAESLLTIITSEGRIEGLYQNALFLLGDLALFDRRYGQAQENYMNIVRGSPGSDVANDAIARLAVLVEVGIDSSGITSDNSVLDSYAGAMEARALDEPDSAAAILLSEKMANSPIAEQALYLAGIIYADADLDVKAVNTLKTYVGKYPEGLFADRAYLALGDQYIKNPETMELGRQAYNKILEAFQEGPVTELARERLRRLESQEKIG